MEKFELEKYHELSYYTLTHPDPSFIHQHLVDVFICQTADENTKNISVAFALAGLYLYIEENYTGRQVQLSHMQMAKNKRNWPAFKLPKQRGAITAANVLDSPPGRERDEMIRKWCAAVWQAYLDNHDELIALVQAELKIMK